jgi:SAM-dependent methyltransferase
MFDLVKRLLGDRAGPETHGVFGSVETATRSSISGWAANIRDRESPVIIQIKAGERLIHEGAASQPRPDIDRIYGLSGAMGFSLAGDSLRGEGEDLGRLELRVRSGPSGEWHPALSPRETHRVQPVGRKSDALDLALGPLRLELFGKNKLADQVLAGLSVLDIGCNERGLYRKASELGARRIVAIDIRNVTADPILPATEVVHGGLWDLPNESFDVIFLSALEHEPEPKRYLRRLRDHLTSDGVLIVECEIGRSTGVHKNSWTTVAVDGNLRRYPSSQILKDDLLEGYAVRSIGTSDEKPADAFPKQIFHCRPFRTIVVLIAGRGGTGKSVIAQLLKAKGFQTFSIDMFLRRVIQSEDYDWSRLSLALRAFRNAPTLRRLDQVGRIIAGENLAEEFATVVLQDLSLETPLLFIEGEILIHERVRSALEQNLRNRGMKVWSMTPSNLP